MPFNPLDHPILFRAPVMYTPASSWVQHIPFAQLLIELHRPRLFVELGTAGGDSYCAFCQAVAELRTGTRCVAIDTWRGDEHEGGYSPAVLNALRKVHDPLFAGFSTLMQTDFDSAVSTFEDGSIDLLHIDGLHSYEAVRHDWETWRAKVCQRRGVVLFHDTQVRDRGFGVFQLWAELSPGFPSFEFIHGSGLGVLVVGDQPSGAFMSFLEGARERPDVTRCFFERLGREIDLLRILKLMVHEHHAHQSMINEWKARTGRPVDPRSRDVQNLLNTPILALQAFGEDLRALLLNQR